MLIVLVEGKKTKTHKTHDHKLSIWKELERTDQYSQKRAAVTVNCTNA